MCSNRRHFPKTELNILYEKKKRYLVECVGSYQLNKFGDQICANFFTRHVTQEPRVFYLYIFTLELVKCQSSATHKHITVDQTKIIHIKSRSIKTQRLPSRCHVHKLLEAFIITNGLFEISKCVFVELHQLGE